jgi:hypothetical protein
MVNLDQQPVACPDRTWQGRAVIQIKKGVQLGTATTGFFVHVWMLQ